MSNIQNIKQRFGIIGNDSQLNFALEKAIRVAPTEISVLVTGESGVGKEVFPRIIIHLSKRKHGINAISNILEMPEETTRRKIEKLIKQGLLSKSKTDGIILSKNFIEKHLPFADQTAKNIGKLIRTFDKAGLLNAAKNFKM